MWTDQGWARKTCCRFNIPRHAHELTFSCFRKLPLLANDRTRGWLIESLSRARRTHGFELWAYVVMPDHVHVILHPTWDDYSISAILQAIKQPVSRRAMNYLRKHAPDWLPRLAVRRSDGHVEHQFWQPGGGYDRNVRQLETLWGMIDYVHLNPVRNGLVAGPADWPWSSARWYDGALDVPIIMDAPPS